MLHRIRLKPRKGAVGDCSLESLESRQLLSASSLVMRPNTILSLGPHHSGHSSHNTVVAGYTPSQIDQAYGFNQIDIGGAVGNGAGQTIAIVDAYDDPNIQSDLHTFDVEFGLPDPSLTQVLQTDGSPSAPVLPGWAMETSLDVEWAHAVAPDANILLVESQNGELSNLLNAVSYASQQPGVVAVSMSWGSSEFIGEQELDSYFTTPAGHPGVTYIAASGDSGPSAGPEWPASSANVLSVGGTTLETTSAGVYLGETPWSGTSGGLSDYEAEPAYQTAANSTGQRQTPDVAYDANPNTGFAVYNSIPFQGVSGWQEVAGTSAGAPQWAALMAIASQERADDGESPLDGATGALPILYGLYSAPNDSTFTSSFHTDSPDDERAGHDYNSTTGLGSPIAPQIVAALVDSPGGTSSGTSAVPSHPHTPQDIIASPAAVTASHEDSASPVFSSGPVIRDRLAPDAERDLPPAANLPAASASGLAAFVSASETAATPVLSASVTFAASAVGTFRDLQIRIGETLDLHGPISSAPAPAMALDLARLDPSMFRDSLRAFAHESATLWTTGGRGRIWTRPVFISATALMADAILVGTWYAGRVRRREKQAAAVPVEQD
jgi:hypothetical protein